VNYTNFASVTWLESSDIYCEKALDATFVLDVAAESEDSTNDVTFVLDVAAESEDSTNDVNAWGRKQKRDPAAWKRNVRKQSRIQGAASYDNVLFHHKW